MNICKLSVTHYIFFIITLSFVFLLTPFIVRANISTISDDGKTYTTTAQDNTPYDTAFKSDGTSMYVLGGATDTIYQYTLSSAWDPSSASYSSKSFSVNAQESDPRGMFFKSDGSTLYVVGTANDTVYQYTLGVAWDISSAAYAGKASPANSGNDTSTIKVHFKSDGSKFLLTGSANGVLYQYTLSTPWDVSSASYSTKSFSMAAQTGGTTASAFNSDGTVFFASSASEVIYQYTVGTAWDVETMSYASLSYNAGAVDSTLTSLVLGSNDTKIFLTGDGSDKVNRFSISLATNPTVNSFSPADNATSVSPTANLVINFSETVTVQSGNITIKKTSDNSTIETISVGSGLVTGTGTSTITINPSVTLAELTAYYVQIDATAFDDVDSNGYAGIADTTTWSFTTGDFTNPTISSLSPADGATGVLTTANLVLTFAEVVDAQAGNITIKKTSDNSTIETISTAGGLVTGTGSTTITVNPSTTLSRGVSYYIQIDSGSFKDSAANSYAGIADTTTWNFTTIPGSNNTTSTQTVTGTIDHVEQIILSCSENATGVVAVSSADANYVILSNSLLFTDSTWQSIDNTGSVPWTFSVTDGSTTLYALFKNTNGSVSTIKNISVDLGNISCDPQIPSMDSDNIDTTVGYSPYDGSIEEISLLENVTLMRGEHYSTVYLLENGKRRPFINEIIFFTWFKNFDDVVIVTDATLSSIPLGKPMVPAPGSLIKIQSLPEVYIVEQDGSHLHHIENEAKAVELFGKDWAKKVMDIDIILFSYFTI